MHPPEHDESTMAASLVAGTVAFALLRGVAMERITEATGLRSTDLVDPDARLSSLHVPAIWGLLLEAHPGRAIALEIAASVPASYFGSVAYAVRNAPSLRAAVGAFVRYQKVLSSDLDVALVEGGALARLEFAHPMDAHDHGCGAEAGIAVGVRFMREVTRAKEALAGVELAHGPHGPVDAYEAHFGVPVRFRRSKNAVLIHGSALDAPTLAPDAQWFLFIQGHLDRVRAELGEAPDPLARVRAAIVKNAEHGEYGAESLAESVGMSSRSLQRLANAHGTTVRVLLDEVRESQARHLLQDARLGVGEVAFLLGYSAESAFRRAFTRWTGHSPAQWRKMNAL